MTTFRPGPGSGFSAVLERAPVSALLVLAYLGLGILTGFLSADRHQLIRYGASVPALVAAGEPWRLLTYSLLHGGLLHLGFNTMALMQLGPALEIRLGSLRFAVLYLVSALGGGLGGTFGIAPFEGDGPFAVYTPLVGGSGALFGMLGALVAMNLRAGRSLLDFFEDRDSRSLLAMIGIYLVIGLLIPFISNSGHIGGLLAGFGVTLWFFDRGRHAEATARARRACQVLFVAAMLGWTAYAAFPVLRADYQFARHNAALEAGRAEEARAWFEAGAPRVVLVRDLDEFWGKAAARRWRKAVGAE